MNNDNKKMDISNFAIYVEVYENSNKIFKYFCIKCANPTE